MGGLDVLVLPTGGANLASLVDAFERQGASCRVSVAAGEFARARRLVLPGVGSAPAARRALEASGLTAALREDGRPLLGVCLGMQMLFERSLEGDTEGLGLLEGRVGRLRGGAGLPVPHMGWSRVRAERESRLLSGLDGSPYFYFVHSYAVPPQRDTVATAEHGVCFAAVVERPPRFGVQFHPERSAADGARLLRNFLEQPGCG